MDSRLRPYPAGYKFSEQIGHLLRRAYQRHISIFQQAMPDAQVTAAQFVALCALRELGASSLNDVVKFTAIDQATIRGIVERLKARKLVDVTADPWDGRKVVVTNTVAGEELVDQITPVGFKISEETFGALNPAERVALVFLLRKMIEAD